MRIAMEFVRDFLWLLLFNVCLTTFVYGLLLNRLNEQNVAPFLVGTFAGTLLYQCFKAAYKRYMNGSR